jgi:hypothetical protein
MKENTDIAKAHGVMDMLLLFIRRQSSTLRPTSFTAMEELSLATLDNIYTEGFHNMINTIANSIEFLRSTNQLKSKQTFLKHAPTYTYTNMYKYVSQYKSFLRKNKEKYTQIVTYSICYVLIAKTNNISLKIYIYRNHQKKISRQRSQRINSKI